MAKPKSKSDDILDVRRMATLGGEGGTAVGSNRRMYDDLLNPGPMPRIIEDTPIQEEDTDIDLLSQYKPETEMSERFKRMLDEYPERQDPSFARKITSMLSGLSTLGTNANNGIEIQDKVLQGPNERRLSDWKEKIRPAEVASSQENQRNAQTRQILGYEQRDRTTEARIKSAEKIAGEKADIARQAAEDKAANDRRKSDILASKAEGYTYTRVGNKLIGHSPDGRTFDAGTAEDFSPMELERLRQTGRVALEGTRQTGRIDLERERTKGDIEVKQTEPAYDPNKTSPEDEVEDPDYRDFIQPGEASTDDWTFTEEPRAGRFWGGATPEEIQNYANMRRELAEKMQKTTPPVRTRPQARSAPSVANPPISPSVTVGTEVGREHLPSNQPTGGTFKFNNPPAGDLKFQTPLTAQGKNVRTGETGTIVSYDGGKTWQPLGK